MFQPQRRQPSSTNASASPSFGETNGRILAAPPTSSTPTPKNESFSPTGEAFEFGSNGTRKKDDDVYSGFDRKGVTPLGVEGNVPYRTSAGRPLQTGGLGFGGARGAIQSRMGMATSSGAGGDGGARPMTSMRAAGYSSRGRTAAVGAGSGFDPFNQAGKTLGLDAGGKPEQSLEELVKILERKVNSLIEESTFAAADGNFPLALEKAKEAGKKERQLTKQREQGSLSDQINLDLTYCVLFNLANQYHGSKMYQEALNTYGVIVKNKLFNQSGRLRVNMGNIYFEQKKYSQAIKMYRMALDQIPNTNKDIRLKIMRNIGSAFVKMGQFQDAITSYEAIMEASPSFHAGFNLVLCYFAMGDRERMKKGFSKLVATRPLAAESSEWEEPAMGTKMVTRNSSSSSTSWSDAARSDDAVVDEQIDDQEVFNEDSLRAFAREHCKAAERYIIMAAKLVAPAIESTFAAGFDWVAETIRTSPMSQIASELEIAKAIQFLKTKEFAQAIETLKAFEKKDQKLVGTAATNLSFLYFLEGENKQAEKYADIAIHADRYNAKALTNRGNGWFAKGNYEKAREYYTEAVSVDATCTEAMYNLGLVYKQEEAYEEALGCFEKLHAILRNHAEVIYQMADICDKMDNLSQAMEWFNILISVAPTDPGVLARMGEMFLRDGDKSQAFQYYSESYRYFPSNMDVIAWLGAYYVDCAVYEQAIQFFERAAMIQPKQVRWPLMVASCHRRSGNYQMAYEVYKKTHENFPDDVECLRFLVRICTDLGAKEVQEYTARLAKAEKVALESPTSAKSGEGNDHRMESSFAARSSGGKVERGSAGSTSSSLNSSGRRKAVKFDLGDANEVSASGASSKKPSGQVREDEDWQDDVDMLLPD